MNRLRLVVTCFCLFYASMVLIAESQYELRIDATSQPSPPPRGRGPFPGSHLPGHSTGFPIHLDLMIAARPLEQNSTALLDFVITNIGTEPLTLPVALGQSTSPTYVLTLYLTSDTIETGHFNNGERMFPIQPTSAELYGESDDPKTFFLLPTGKSIRVHASTRLPLKLGAHSLAAHAELLALSEGRSKVLGTAESVPVSVRFSASNPAAQ